MQLGRPIIEKTPSGLRRVTRFHKLDPDAAKVANIEAAAFVAYGTADVEFPTAVLVEQKIDRRSEQGAAATLIQVFQELANNLLTATTEVSESTLPDGRRITRTLYLCKASQADNLKPAIAGGVFQVDVAKNGPVATVTKFEITLTDLGFIYSQSDDSRNNGKLLTRTIRTLGSAAATPSGYTLVSSNTATQDGYTVYTSTFAKGLGRISTDVAYRQNGKLKITTIRFLTSDDGATPDGTLVNDDSQAQDGYVVYTKGYAEIVGNGVISSNSETRNNGKMVVYRTVRLGSEPTTPAATIGGAVVLVQANTKQEDGFTLYDYQWIEGRGRISLETETRNGGALVFNTVRFLTVDDGATPSGVLVRSSVQKQDGADITTNVYASGSGQISQEDESRNGGKLLRITIRHLVQSGAANPIVTPTGYTSVMATFAEQDGQRLWTAVFAKGQGRVSLDTTYRQNGKLKLTTVRYLGTDDGAAVSGTLIKSDEQAQEGYSVVTKDYAEVVGDGVVFSSSESRNANLVVYRKTRLGLAPATPSATIGGTVALVSATTREEDGFTLYDYQWAEGFGEVDRSTEYRRSDDLGNTGLTIVRVRTLTAEGAGLALSIAGFVKTSESYDDQQGYRLWTTTFAKGVGTVESETITQNNGRLVIYRKTALGGAPSAPSPTIGGSVVLIRSDQRNDDGVIVYSYQWAEGYGVISKTLTPREGGLRLETWVSLGVKNTPPGVVMAEDTDEVDGVTRYTVSCMQGPDGGDPSTGSVATIAVTNGGSGYTSAPTVSISGGGGSGATAVAILSGSSVASITLSTPGSGYTSAPTVVLTGGGGTGATAVATLTATSVASVSLIDAGSGFTSAPSVSASGGGGTGATFSATLTGTSLASLAVTNGGSGYTSAPTVSFSGGGGTGATATANISPAGAVISISLTAGGSGYTSAPTIVFTGGGGSGAAAIAVLAPTSVASVSVVSGGSGYTSAPTVAFYGGGGSGATATANLTPPGVGSVTLTASGGNYTSAPTVGFSGGGGSGAAGTAVLSGGNVDSISVTDGGSGYTSPPTIVLSGGGGTGATASAVLSTTGSLAAVTILSGGTGYLSAPTVSITGGGGTGATATAVLTPEGKVGSAAVTSGGSGYEGYVTAQVSGGGGSGAVLTARFAPTSLASIPIPYANSFSGTPTVTITPQFGTGGSGAAATAIMDGFISSANITSYGSGYTSRPTVVLTGGGGSGAELVAKWDSATGQVIGLAIVSRGTGYTSAPTVSFTGGGGSGAAGNVGVETNGVVGYNITNAGSGYEYPPRVVVSTGSGGRVLEGVLSPTSVASLLVSNTGSGYTSTPSVSISAGGGGVRAFGFAKVSGGAITEIVLLDIDNLGNVTPKGGSGYTSAPTISLTGGGSGATFSVSMSGGSVSSVTVTNGGSGYSEGSLTVSFSTPVAGSGATGTVSLSSSVSSVNVTGGGSGYTSNPTISFSGGSGSGATASSSRSFPVSSVNVTSGGTGYTSAPTVSFTGGGGSGAAATSAISQGISEIVITNPGTGYSTPPTVTITGGGGSGATAVAILAPTSVASVSITSGGTGYNSAPSVSFSGGGGTGASATAALSGAAVAAFVLTNGGSGYSSAPTVSTSGGGGTGATGTTVLSLGTVTQLTLTDPGSGYTSAPTVSLSGGGGTGASATAALSGTSLAGIAVTGGGTGFTSAPTIIISGGGGVALALAALTPTSVASLTVTAGGSGYSSAPTVALTGGGGSGASAIAVLTSGNTVIGVQVTAGGTGYTSAPSVSFSGGGGSGAAATASLPSAMTYQVYERFTYPGRAKYFSQTVTIPTVGTATAHDVFLSPPVEALVLATVEISYKTTAALAALVATLWNPTESATLNAKWVGWAGAPTSKVQGLRGYRAVNSGASGTTVSGYNTSVLGDRVFSGATWAISLEGGPADPGGVLWTLTARTELAFVAKDGTKYYRHIIITATPPAQAALPV